MAEETRFLDEATESSCAAKGFLSVPRIERTMPTAWKMERHKASVKIGFCPLTALSKN